MDEIRYNLKTLNRQFQLASKQRKESADNLISLWEQSLPGIRKLLTARRRRTAARNGQILSIGFTMPTVSGA